MLDRPKTTGLRRAAVRNLVRAVDTAYPLWISATPIRSSKRSCGLNCWEHRSPLRASRLSLRLQPGHHHSYHFVSMFMPHHVAWHR